MAESCTDESNDVQNYINWHCKEVERINVCDVLAEGETDESKQMGGSYKLYLGGEEDGQSLKRMSVEGGTYIHKYIHTCMHHPCC